MAATGPQVPLVEQQRVGAGSVAVSIPAERVVPAAVVVDPGGRGHGMSAAALPSRPARGRGLSFVVLAPRGRPGSGPICRKCPSEQARLGRLAVGPGVPDGIVLRRGGARDHLPRQRDGRPGRVRLGRRQAMGSGEPCAAGNGGTVRLWLREVWFTRHAPRNSHPHPRPSAGHDSQITSGPVIRRTEAYRNMNYRDRNTYHNAPWALL